MLRFLLAVALTASLLAIPAARAQELTGTLKKIKDSKTMTLGYRESSIPFSYVNKVGEPIGYSIDLCNAVVDEVSKELEGVEIAVKYKKVTAETRIPAVQSGEVDLECGSTTANFERKKEVAFSPIFFVAGTKFLVPRSSGISSYLVLLYGLVATARSGDQYQVVGEYLSYDPYGLMYRKDDPDFAAIVDRTFSRLAQSRELVQLYNKWFQQRLPTGETLDLPMSLQLDEIFRVEGVPD